MQSRFVFAGGDRGLAGHDAGRALDQVERPRGGHQAAAEQGGRSLPLPLPLPAAAPRSLA